MRQGYHAFKPSKSNVTRDLHLSPNPVKGAHGAGLLSAEEMTSKQTKAIQPIVPVSEPPTPKQQAKKIESAVSTPKKPSTNQSYLKSPSYLREHFVRKEACAVVQAINKKEAFQRAYSAGIKDLSERNVRRLFIKQLFPFNK